MNSRTLHVIKPPNLYFRRSTPTSRTSSDMIYHTHQFSTLNVYSLASLCPCPRSVILQTDGVLGRQSHTLYSTVMSPDSLLHRLPHQTRASSYDEAFQTYLDNHKGETAQDHGITAWNPSEPVLRVSNRFHPISLIFRHFRSPESVATVSKV